MASHTSSRAADIWEIIPIPGKGHGMVAATAIARGSLILLEAPIIRIKASEKLGYEAAQFESLSAENQACVLALTSCREGEKSRLMGIVWTNAIPVCGMDADAGLFVVAARINHACNPNTHHSWDREQASIRTYATREIAKGEEITSTYVRSFGPFKERQAHLLSRLGFSCRCDLCCLPEPERSRSDEQMREIRRLRRDSQSIDRLAGFPILGFRTLRKLLQLYKSEDIVDAHPAEAYVAAYWVADRMGDAQRAAVFARRAREVYAIVEGWSGYKARQMGELERKAREKARQSSDSGWGASGDDVMPDETVGDEELEAWLFKENVIATTW